MPQLKGLERYNYITERENAGMNQKEIASKLGLTHSNLRNWLNRNRKKYSTPGDPTQSYPNCQYYPNTNVQDPKVYNECIELLRSIYEDDKACFGDDICHVQDNEHSLPSFKEALEWRLDFCDKYGIEFYSNEEYPTIQSLNDYWSKYFEQDLPDKQLLSIYLKTIPSLRNIGVVA